MRTIRLGMLIVAGVTAAGSVSAANPPTAPAVVVAPPYTPRPPATLSTGQGLLRLRLTSVNGTPVSSEYIRAVPVVVGVKGNKVGLGGKYGPQVTGAVTNGTLAISGKTPGGGTLTLVGSGGGGTGKFTMTQGGVTLGGEYVLDPVGAGVPGETRAGVGTTSGFTSLTPATAGWNGTGPTVSGSGMQNTGNGYSSGMSTPSSSQSKDFSTNAQKVPGKGYVPGGGNTGPNFGGTPISGWYSDDNSDPSPLSPIGPKDSSSSSGATKDPSSKVQGWVDPSQRGGNDSSSSGGIIDSIKKWWAGLNWGSGGSSGGSSSKTGKETNPMDDGAHNAGTSGSGLNFGRIPGAGGEKGGGNNNAGGVSAANGSTLNKPLPMGDNPFEVSAADVLNTNHLINGASDPGITRGMAH